MQRGGGVVPLRRSGDAAAVTRHHAASNHSTTSTATSTTTTATATASKEGGGPSMHCGEKLRKFIMRAAPSALNMIGDLIRLAVAQRWDDETVLKQVASVLGVGLDGWPTDPVARRRVRLERFYQFNAGQGASITLESMDRILQSPDHTEDKIMTSLYAAYNRNEIGESLDPDVALSESLRHVFACTKPAMLSEVDAFVAEQAASGLTHEEYLEEVCLQLGVSTDGWPTDPDDRLRQRLIVFYTHNDPPKMDRVNVLMARDFSEEEIFNALYERYGRDELGHEVLTERRLRHQLELLLHPTMNEHAIDGLIAYRKERRWTDVELILSIRRQLNLREDGWPQKVSDRLVARLLRYFATNSNCIPMPNPNASSQLPPKSTLYSVTVPPLPPFLQCALVVTPSEVAAIDSAAPNGARSDKRSSGYSHGGGRPSATASHSPPPANGRSPLRTVGFVLPVTVDQEKGGGGSASASATRGRQRDAVVGSDVVTPLTTSYDVSEPIVIRPDPLLTDSELQELRRDPSALAVMLDDIFQEVRRTQVQSGQLRRKGIVDNVSGPPQQQTLPSNVIDDALSRQLLSDEGTRVSLKKEKKNTPPSAGGPSGSMLKRFAGFLSIKKEPVDAAAADEAARITKQRQEEASVADFLRQQHRRSQQEGVDGQGGLAAPTLPLLHPVPAPAGGRSHGRPESKTSNRHLDSATAEEEGLIFQHVQELFGRDESGAVVLPVAERHRLRSDLIRYLEPFYSTPGSLRDPSAPIHSSQGVENLRDIFTAADTLSSLPTTSDNIWRIARHITSKLPHPSASSLPLCVLFRQHVCRFLQRCGAVGEAAAAQQKADQVMETMYEEGLSMVQVLDTMRLKFGCDVYGWPDALHGAVMPTGAGDVVSSRAARRRRQLTMLLEKHDSRRLPLIDRLYMTIPHHPTDVDQLYRSLCEEFGADEFCRTPGEMEATEPALWSALGLATTSTASAPSVPLVQPAEAEIPLVHERNECTPPGVHPLSPISSSSSFRPQQLSPTRTSTATIQSIQQRLIQAAQEAAAAVGQDFMRQLALKYRHGDVDVGLIGKQGPFDSSAHLPHRSDAVLTVAPCAPSASWPNQQIGSPLSRQSGRLTKAFVFRGPTEGDLLQARAPARNPITEHRRAVAETVVASAAACGAPQEPWRHTIPTTSGSSPSGGSAPPASHTGRAHAATVTPLRFELARMHTLWRDVPPVDDAVVLPAASGGSGGRPPPTSERDSWFPINAR